MSSTTPAEPQDLPPDATPEEIEADIEAARERLASSVDALTAKLDVKAQAKQKAQETSAQAKQKAQESLSAGQAEGPGDLGARWGRRSAGLRAGAHHLASGVASDSRRRCRTGGTARPAAAALFSPKLSAPGHLGTLSVTDPP